MFEAQITPASTLKKIMEAIKDLVSDANFDCTAQGISLQAMDSAHVSLVSLLLRADEFDKYRCDRNVTLGINLASMTKILKCASNEDTVTLKADDSAEIVSFIFESANKISNFELKLLTINPDILGIPEQKYGVVVTMPSAEFQRITRDLQILGDTVVIAATKEGVKFSVNGELGNGNITCKPTGGADLKEGEETHIEIDEAVQLTFALRYLNSFTKATALSPSVRLCMSKDVPLVVEYRIENIGYVRYYLAPKIEDDN
eukprot:TRINITY_DN4615_c0_g1_i1.p1 TRINITY_DN4615_c0_g1~~TRINITY_DN4615_c0_g1_i1.p1  ORF type:complete len:259 (+),score=67.39 TRINITY_DN4615_c0_g1_i1:85-861(+)